MKLPYLRNLIQNNIFKTLQWTVYNQEEVNKEKKEVNKQENLENQDDVNKQEKSLMYGFNMLLFYPILTFSFFYIIFDFPEVILFLTILWKKIICFFADEPAFEITAAPTIEYLSLKDYWSEEYIIYKKIFLNQITNDDASLQLYGLKKTMHPADVVSLENRLSEEVLNKYIQNFLVEKYGEYSTFNWFEKIKYFLRCEEYHLKLLFTKEFLIPSLTLSEYNVMEYKGYTGLETLKKRLSLDDLKTLEGDTPVGVFLNDVDTLQPKPAETLPAEMPVLGPAGNVKAGHELIKIKNDLLDSINQTSIDRQSHLCKEFNVQREKIIAFESVMVGMRPQKADAIKHDTDVIYQDAANKYMVLSRDSLTEHRKTFADAQASSNEALKLDGIDLSDQPFTRRQPVDVTIQFSGNRKEEAIVLREMYANETID